MEKELEIKINEEDFENHVKRICRSNTKKPCKICIECPFKEYVLKIMNKYNWKYNKILK